MLLSLSGHIQIADFDSAYDTTQSQLPPKPEDFKGASYYMPPEIANEQSISFAADIWNLGMTMGRMLSRSIRPHTNSKKEEFDMIRKGKWYIEGLEHMEEPLKLFFKSCFRLNPIERPSIEEIKQMEIFSDGNWDAEALMNRSPPYQIDQLCDRVEKEKYSTDPFDKMLLRTVKWKGIPNLRPAEYCGRDPVITKLRPIRSDIGSLKEAGMTPEAVAKLFADFEFINEKIVQSPS